MGAKTVCFFLFSLSAFACPPGSFESLSPRRIVSAEDFGTRTKAAVDSLSKEAVSQPIREKLSEWVRRNAHYLSDEKNLKAFEHRLKKMTAAQWKEWEGVLPPPGLRDPKSHEALSDALFLTLIHTNLRETVWNAGAPTRADMKKLGLDAAKFWNVTDASQVASQFEKAQAHVNLQALDAALGARVGFGVKRLTAEPALFEIYSDAIRDAVVESLEKKLPQLTQSAQKRAAVEALLKELRPSVKKDGIELSVTGRDVDSFKGGNKAGDCTATDSFNYWTQGPWNLAMENVELNFDYKGKFFSRMIGVAGVADGKPVLYVHAAEFTPLARGGAGVEGALLQDPKEQAKALDATMKSLAAYAKRAGFHSVEITDISNSSSYPEQMAGAIAKAGGTEGTDAKLFSLLSPLESVHAIRDQLGAPAHAVPVYFQGWDSDAEFDRQMRPRLNYDPEAEKKVLIGETAIGLHDFQRAAPVLDDIARQLSHKLDQVVFHLPEREALAGRRGNEEDDAVRLVQSSALAAGDRSILNNLETKVVEPLSLLLGDKDPLVQKAKEALLAAGAGKSAKPIPERDLQFINGFSDDLVGNPRKWNVSKDAMLELLRKDEYWRTRLPPAADLERLLSNLPDRKGTRDPDALSDQWTEALQGKLSVSEQNKVSAISAVLRKEILHSRFPGLALQSSYTEKTPDQASKLVATLKKEFPQQWKQFEDSIRNGTYSDEAKAALLQHPEQLLSQYWSGNAGGVDSGMRDTSSRLFTWSLPAR